MQNSTKNIKSLILIILTILLIILSTKNITTSNTSENNSKSNNIENLSNQESTLSNLTDFNYYRKVYNNNEIMARLEIPNMINILITQTSNNEYYLTHSITKQKDYRGTEFMDYRVTPTSKQINIYGHNSNTIDVPFHKLELFLNEDYFLNNPTIILEHEERIRTYQIIAIKEVSNDYEHMRLNLEEQSYLNHLQKITTNTLYNRKVDFTKDSNILILQTCSYNEESSFIIIIALEIE